MGFNSLRGMREGRLIPGNHVRGFIVHNHSLSLRVIKGQVVNQYFTEVVSCFLKPLYSCHGFPELKTDKGEFIVQAGLVVHCLSSPLFKHLLRNRLAS